ncbi:hypothetical protein [Roseateles sp. P5_D6]
MHLLPVEAPGHVPGKALRVGAEEVPCASALAGLDAVDGDAEFHLQSVQQNLPQLRKLRSRERAAPLGGDDEGRARALPPRQSTMASWTAMAGAGAVNAAFAASAVRKRLAVGAGLKGLLRRVRKAQRLANAAPTGREGRCCPSGCT